MALTCPTQAGVQLRLLHAKQVLPNGEVEFFAEVSPGQVQLMCCKPSDLPGAAAAVAAEAVRHAEEEFEVKGAMMNFCAGTASNLQDFEGLRKALAEELPCGFLCFFSYGEIGMVRGRSHFGNLMVNLWLFG